MITIRKHMLQLKTLIAPCSCHILEIYAADRRQPLQDLRASRKARDKESFKKKNQVHVVPKHG
jgi:hypothetical protein